jgi:hypothetical protein
MQLFSIPNVIAQVGCCAGLPTKTLLVLLVGTALQQQPFFDDSTTPTTSLESLSQSQLSIVEVIKVYGKLAGRSCYGQLAPVGSSCQLTRSDLDTKLFGVSFHDVGTALTTAKLSRDAFQYRLQQQDQLEFGWPLKPFGVAGSPSLVKTATMNKGVEARIYNQLLERNHLYNPHNPTSPLPSSLRPQLNQILQQQGIDPNTVDAIYRRFLGTDRKATTTTSSSTTTTLSTSLTREQLDKTLFAQQEELDFYEFLEFLGVDNISWTVPGEDTLPFKDDV